MIKPIEIHALPHSQARELVAGGAPVYLHVNPVEYHGPHLPLYNDYFLSVAATLDLHSRLQKSHSNWPLLFAAPLHLGVDPVAGFGTQPTSYRALRTAVLKACKGLEALGVKRVIIMTFHGSPLHAMAIQAGVEYLESRGIAAVAPFNYVLHEMLVYKPGNFDKALAVIEDERVRAQVRDDLANDFHGGFFETSLVLHYRPDTVAADYRSLPVCPEVKPHAIFGFLSRLMHRLGFKRLAAEMWFAAYGLGWVKLNPLPGYTGSPHLARAEAGAVFAETIMGHYVRGVEGVFSRQSSSPQPIMKWLKPLSLGGRLATH